MRAGREEIDAINVFPVADGDTGTNLLGTLEAASRTLADAPAAPEDPGPSHALDLLARGALLGARGNSGTILAQLLRGAADALREETGDAKDGAPHTPAPELLCRVLRRAADSAYAAVARPVEGTMLTVADAAAEAAARAADGDVTDVARAAYEGARAALAETTGRLDALRAAGVVDAGGEGLVRILGALVGGAVETRPAGTAARPALGGEGAPGGPAYEVMYLLDEADDEAVRTLRAALDALGDSLVIGGGDGLWSVHVHTDDAGAAVEAGIGAGRPHRVRVTYLAAGDGGTPCGQPETAAPEARAAGTAGSGVRRAVVAAVHGEGLARLYEEAGAYVVRLPEPASGDPAPLLGAAGEARAAGAREMVLLPNGGELHAAAARAAEEARARGLRVAVIPTRAAVQGLAALAVHDAGRAFDEDVVAMTAAAGATRYGEVTVAEHRSWTTAGICQAGDVLGLVDGDVAVIGTGVAEVAAEVLERMLAAGGELVTLVLGERYPAGLARRLEGQVRRGHLAVDTVVHEGRQPSAPLLVGVE
nr:DAK2 domain-containing protein [Streptomyces sp. HNM0574]